MVFAKLVDLLLAAKGLIDARERAVNDMFGV
jgi:hypothetical protein